VSPPGRAAAPGVRTEGGAKTTEQAGQHHGSYLHDPVRCVTCSGVQHRDVIGDLWWTWATPYRCVLVATS